MNIYIFPFSREKAAHFFFKGPEYFVLQVIWSLSQLLNQAAGGQKQPQATHKKNWYGCVSMKFYLQRSDLACRSQLVEPGSALRYIPKTGNAVEMLYHLNILSWEFHIFMNISQISSNSWKYCISSHLHISIFITIIIITVKNYIAFSSPESRHENYLSLM